MSNGKNYQQLLNPAAAGGRISAFCRFVPVAGQLA
jgi:hypothetical protein